MISKDELLLKATQLITTMDVPASHIEAVHQTLNTPFKPFAVNRTTVAAHIDHTILAFDAKQHDIEKICNEADDYHFGAVCVNPVWVPRVYEYRKYLRAGFKIAAVIDFPLGASTANARREEASDSLKNGADELDIVISIGKLKSGHYRAVYELLKAAIEPGGYTKVILEMSALNDDEKIAAALIAILAGAHMVKTSTGVNGKAVEDDVRLLRLIAGGKLGVKAAGGIRSIDTAKAMFHAGADRIGASASVEIINMLGGE